MDNCLAIKPRHSCKGFLVGRVISTVVFQFAIMGLFLQYGAKAYKEESRLFKDLFEVANYDKLARPAVSPADVIRLRFGISIVQLIDVDERNQVMTTSVWIRQEWQDERLEWNPKNYSGIDNIAIPEDLIWMPDTVLYNIAEISAYGGRRYPVKAVVNFDGTVVHIPPAVFKSPCPMDIEFFPFDYQKCTMKFGTWSYSGNQIILEIMEDKAPKEDFSENDEWEIIDTPGYNYTVKYPCCADTYSHIIYTLVLRRKPLFYIINLLLPCILMMILTIAVFWLPPDSGEKISLSISILLASTVFQLLVAEIMPATSSATPLIGKYLVFTTFIVSSSIVVTVAVLNCHYRTGHTHRMRKWVKTVFMKILPRLLNMSYRREAPSDVSSEANFAASIRRKSSNTAASEAKKLETYICSTNGNNGVKLCHQLQETDVSTEEKREKCLNLLKEVQHISKHFQNEEQSNSAKEDWRYVALVLDRLFLCIFSVVCISGTLIILLKGWQ